MKENEKKIIVINGATGGIGCAIVKKLAQQGYSLALVGRNIQKLSYLKDEVLSLLRDNHVEVFVVPELKKESVERIANTILQKYNYVYGYINSAGYVKQGRMLEVSDEHWDKLFNISLMNNIWFISTLAPEMIKKKEGRIVFINGIFSIEPSPDCIINGTFTGATRNFAKALSKDFGRYNLTVNTINPGPTDTPLWQNIITNLSSKLNIPSSELHTKSVAEIPLNRIGNPEDIANCTAYLCSTEAGYINGANFTIDGGLTASC